MNIIKLKINEFREKAALSKNALSKLTGIDFSKCASHCNNTNKTDPTFPTLKKYADVFKVEIKELFEQNLTD